MQKMPNASLRRRITIFDGGMGTTLESSGHDISSALWSADPKLADAVKEVHEGFMAVGAELIGSATYQAAPRLYHEIDPSLDDQSIASMMRDNFWVTAKAVEDSNRTACGTAMSPRGVVLSLGPYGATLSPGQEYSACYPPPFGPSAWSSSSTATNVPTFPSASSSHELSTLPTSRDLLASISALTDFHLSRLLIFALDEATWRAVEWVGFETIPLLREGLAIRAAMRELESRLEERYGQHHGDHGDGKNPWWRKRWWTSFVFPSGRFPDGAEVEDITRVMTAACHPAILSPQGVNLELPVPSALGINCTSPAYVGELSRRFTEALRTLEPKMEIGFVLYPDGGLTYNPVTKTWHAPSSNSEPAGSDAVAGDQSWAHKLGSVAVELSSASTKGDAATQLPVWNEVIVGGCCKAGYDEIRGLKEWIAAADI